MLWKEEGQHHLLCVEKPENKETRWDYNKAKHILDKEKRLFTNLNLVNTFLYSSYEFPFQCFPGSAGHP